MVCQQAEAAAEAGSKVTGLQQVERELRAKLQQQSTEQQTLKTKVRDSAFWSSFLGGGIKLYAKLIVTVV